MEFLRVFVARETILQVSKEEQVDDPTSKLHQAVVSLDSYPSVEQCDQAIDYPQLHIPIIFSKGGQCIDIWIS